MEIIMKKPSEDVFEIPRNVEKTGIYPAKRIIDGEEDNIDLFLWSAEDLKVAKDYAKMKAKEASLSDKENLLP